ncbi:UDP-N-acetylmuramoyl-L-alanyl-D-glutamate--2,6-diaminopimelate ligase [uncultured Desulfovibrio sp.]|uniref:UDP-N-acetylmuramoyl-L-alanyl-D-glutamate--2, 6-diaminopimelate ligase n=1 Tax=uncultured Desulfovibrio sp. TaxID=167968 RepID=UPI00039F7365|nr:UDP-N-acetylmuramoyl-L-alanyl-D-glutamate--2,6-diaminopimelate ligase [uncultured Desulfovibrio sp.]
MQRDFADLLETCRRGGVEVRSDSRAVARDDIFVAVPGVNEDGARFIPAAVEAGAAVVVCRPGGPEEAAARNSAQAAGCRVVHHDDPREALWRLAEARWHTDALRIKVLGVTGTNGKTTSTYLLERLFTDAGHKVGVLGTVSYRWPGHSEVAPLTTPDPLKAHSMLAQMDAAGVDVAVMEVSSHAIDQQRVCGVPFAGAAFTNLTQDHLDFHKDMESYFKTKAKLFLELPRGDKAMAVNADDPWGRRLLELCPRALSFGLQQGPPRRRHLWGELLSAGTGGCHLRMHLEGRTWELRSPLVGAFNASNLLTVQALALEACLDPEQFTALESFTGVCGRLERVDNPQGLSVFVDYAHTPDALVNVLKALRGAGFKRIITVFGCGGNRDRSKRPLMGEAVARYADVAVLTSDNPRFEEPGTILQDVLPGLRGAREVLVEVDRRAATAKALDMLNKDGALLIAGKGHEDYQIIQGVKHRYSDQEVVRELLHCA